MVRLFLLICCLGVVMKVQCQEQQTKVETLLELSKTHDVISLTAETFKKYVVDQSRQYIIVVFFSSYMYKSQCPGCQALEPIFNEIAYSYKALGHTKPKDQNENKAKPVFFAFLDYGQETQIIYQKFGFSNIPNIYVSTKSFTEETTSYSIDRSKLWEYRDGQEITSNKILDFINKKTERDVTIQKSLLQTILPISIVLTILILIFALVYFIKHNFTSPKLWWFGCTIIYITCMAGVVYDIIHSSSLIGTNPQTGEDEFIAQGPRSQYILEGFLMSFLISLGSLGLILLNSTANYKNSWLMRLIGIFSIALILYSIYQVSFAYKNKVSWYTPSFDPPSHYKKGGLIADQGNSF
ncbi:hypothetical protein SteCoe_28862 [Stentor coeruleus]|uniref:Thioredoxin domain-containing protein n=1 Tax=Stentor coeruleus TaxID=5963 RepID=A0A1R2B795_9CILI|nr:hypothetical protein SteCoe_28862 [Stentor coeruleus]